MKQKEYLFNFVGGGWNSVWAKTKRGAIAQALKKYKGDNVCVVDVNSFRLCSEGDYRNLMSLFY